MPSFTRRVRPGVTASSAASRSSSTASPSASTSTSTPTSTSNLPGTKPYPSAPLRFVSTGIPSLDDVLGSLPLGSTLTLLAPDPHTQWARLVARHTAAAGLLDGQRLLVLSPMGEEWAAGLPWVEGESGLEAVAGAESESETEAMEDDGRTKIAWRYDKMAKFRTSVGEAPLPLGPSSRAPPKLTPGSSRLAANTTLPAPLRAQLEAAGTISYVDPGDGLASAVEALAAALAAAPTDQVVRVVVPELGSRDWPLAAPEIPRFLLCLRALLRHRPAVGAVTLPPTLSTSPTPTSPSASASTSPDSNTWITSLAHASDACLTLQGFGTSPGHFRAFAPLHGLLTPHALPSPHHLLSPACRHSTLLGVKDGGEQNLGFRLKRKKFVVESVHLGIEGGTSERRTAPVEKVVPAVDKAAVAEAAEGVERAAAEKAGTAEPASAEKEKPKKPRARVRFGSDEVAVSIDKNEHAHSHDHDHGHAHPHSHPKPRVEIRHDRPDLYEF